MDNNTLTPAQQKTFATDYVRASAVPVDDTPVLTPAEQQAIESAKAQTAELMTLKAALIETTASRGWPYIQKFAETVVRELEREALAEEDDAKANGLRRDARGARKFKDELFKRIAIAKHQDPATFLEVITG